MFWTFIYGLGPHHHNPRFIYLIFKFFQPIPDPPSSMSILAPAFPVNLEVLLIKIAIVLFFDH